MSAPSLSGKILLSTRRQAFRGYERFPDDSNHRFTSDKAVFDQLVANGWDGEGSRMCAPQ